MTDYFRQQLAYYADAHRNQVNSVMHIIGNPLLFVAVVLPLCLLPLSLFGVQTNLAPLLVIPALIIWTAWDIAIGLAIVVTCIPLLFAAAAIASWVNAALAFVCGDPVVWKPSEKTPLTTLATQAVVECAMRRFGNAPDSLSIVRRTGRPGYGRAWFSAPCYAVHSR